MGDRQWTEPNQSTKSNWNCDCQLRNEIEAKQRLSIRIVLPFPLPTWNRVLAMHPWARKKMRDMIHEAVWIALKDAAGLTQVPNPTDLAKLAAKGATVYVERTTTAFRSAVSTFIASAGEPVILTPSVQKLSSMGWNEQEYFRLIRPSSSASRLAHKKSSGKGRKRP